MPGNDDDPSASLPSAQRPSTFSGGSASRRTAPRSTMRRSASSPACTRPGGGCSVSAGRRHRGGTQESQLKQLFRAECSATHRLERIAADGTAGVEWLQRDVCTTAHNTRLEGGPHLKQDETCVDFLHGEERSQRLRDRREVDAVLRKRLSGECRRVSAVHASSCRVRRIVAGAWCGQALGCVQQVQVATQIRCRVPVRGALPGSDGAGASSPPDQSLMARSHRVPLTLPPAQMYTLD